MKIKFQNQTALIRVLFSLEDNMTNSNVKIKDLKVFPLGFCFYKDSPENFFSNIENSIRDNPDNLLQEVGLLESGVYEMIAEYRARIEVKDKQVEDCIWKVFDEKINQLTSEDEEFLKTGS